MRIVVGRFFQVVGSACLLVGSIGGLILSLAVVVAAAGFWGIVLAFVLTPLTMVVAPWYALFAWGNLIPLVVSYGGLFSGYLLLFLGEKVIESKKVERSEEFSDLSNSLLHRPN